MQAPTLALILVATLLGAGCASKETKPEPAPPPVKQAETPPVPVTPPKPECKPEPSAKVKSTKSKNKKTTEAPVVDCEPPQAKPAATQPAAAPVAATPAAANNAKAEPGKPRVVKSRDGTFEGEIYGNIPANSKWARLQIGMEQAEVERILGSSHEVRHTPTGKAFIPFYYGTDRYRYEIVYRGQGSVSYTGGGIGGGRGVLMMINYDPNI